MRLLSILSGVTVVLLLAACSHEANQLGTYSSFRAQGDFVCFSQDKSSRETFKAKESTLSQARYKAVEVCKLHAKDPADCKLSRRGCVNAGYENGKWICISNNTQTGKNYKGTSPLKRYAYNYSNFYCTQGDYPYKCERPVCHFQSAEDEAVRTVSYPGRKELKEGLLDNPSTMASPERRRGS